MGQSVTPSSLQLRACWWGVLDFGVYIILSKIIYTLFGDDDGKYNIRYIIHIM